MIRAEIESRLTDVMRDFFELPQLEIDPSMTASQVEGWDSIAHVGLIVAVEKTFALRFTTREVKSLQTVGDLCAVLERRTG